MKYRIPIPRIVLIVVLTLSAIATIPPTVRSAGSAQSVYLPMIKTSDICNPNDVSQVSNESRYLQFCTAPRVHWIVTSTLHPESKIEWLLPEDPTKTLDARNLWLTIPEAATEGGGNIALANLMIRTRIELQEAHAVSADTFEELKAVAVGESTGAITPQQIELAVGLAFAGPPGWVVAGVIIAVAAVVVLYVVLKNTRQDFTAGKTISEVFTATSDDAFSIDSMKQGVSQGEETTPYISSEIKDGYLEGTPARREQALQGLRDAERLIKFGYQPYCQHRPDKNGGTTALWFNLGQNRWFAFFHRPDNGARDSGLYRPRLHSYPRGGEKEYTDEPGWTSLCSDAMANLLWRILCYISNPGDPMCNNPPWNPLNLTQRSAFGHERRSAYGA